MNSSVQMLGIDFLLNKVYIIANKYIFYTNRLYIL